MGTRKGLGAFYQDSRGYWTAALELPRRNGKRRRMIIRDRSKDRAIEKMQKAQMELRERGDINTEKMTVKTWFTYWLDNIVVPRRTPNTSRQYERIIFEYIVPVIGSKQLRQLTPVHIRDVLDSMMTATPDRRALSSSYAANAHTVLCSGLEAAVREERIMRNVARLVDAPIAEPTNLDAFTLQESIALYRHLLDLPMEERALWLAPLLTGGRRGEMIGLERDRIGDEIDLSWQLQRINWRHGCAPDREPPRCGHAYGTHCPERYVRIPKGFEHRQLIGALYLTRPKSKKGWRQIPLVDPLASVLRHHIATSDDNPWGLVFTRDGRPIDPGQQSKDWRKLLAGTGIDRDVRLHDVRHTTVDLLTIAGVPDDVIMAIVGHSKRATMWDYRRRNDITRLRLGMTSMGELFNLPGDVPPAIAS
ncbi:site-specific integrase [Curtobacterium sp. C1]|uniref:site-specific integrase n=1 Tax=Curtobacterium sp. C1 TaxID=2898151 RepID=UPI001E4EBD67|nr:site-specific integrase [Curtobacterium sp. C1]UFU14589.1 site-specific integrase [Curtobacterium sp. C1]